MESKKKLFDKIKSEPAKLPIKTVEPAPAKIETEDRTSIQIRKSLHSSLKVSAAKTGKKLQDLVEEILIDYLKKSE